MTETEQLKHRLAMVADDLKVLRKFIQDSNLTRKFEEPTEVSEKAWHNISNIEIACDLTSDESLKWKLFSR